MGMLHDFYCKCSSLLPSSGYFLKVKRLQDREYFEILQINYIFVS